MAGSRLELATFGGTARSSCPAGRAASVARVQWRARRHGIAGIDGNPGTLESVTYRICKTRESSNPTLSAILRSLEM